MTRAMAGEHLVRCGKRKGLQDFRIKRLVHGVAASTRDDQEFHGGQDRHRITRGVRGRGTNEFQALRIVFRSVRERREPGIRIAPGGTQHAWAMGGDPDLGPFAAIRWQIEYRIVKRKER
jgi:hypothetical protein